jgi:CCR4-NOT transcriptional regulation complex NOT5 subunit
MLVNSIPAGQAENMAMINYLQDSIAYTTGVPGSTPPRIQIPVPIVNNAPVTQNTHNNIHVENSVVGSINTAQVGRINVAMNDISNGNDESVKLAIKTITEAMVNSSELEGATKDQLLEQMAFIAEQASLPVASRQRSVVVPVLSAISASLSGVASLATIWSQWGDNLSNFFSNLPN